MEDYFASVYFWGDELPIASNIKFKIFNKIFAVAETKHLVVLRERNIVLKNVSKQLVHCTFRSNAMLKCSENTSYELENTFSIK